MLNALYTFHLAVTVILCFGLSGRGFSSAAEETLTPHAFIQTGEELHYFSDVADQEIFLTTLANDHDFRDVPPEDVEIFPPSLDFPDTPVGVPAALPITFINRRKNKLTLLAVSSNSMHFQINFPTNSELDENDEVVIMAYFLPPVADKFHAKFVLFTSEGKVEYMVSGVSSTNPYRLPPLKQVQMPLNGTLLTPITLHNPHCMTVTVKEISSSNPFIHIELPGSELEELHEDTFWEIAPYETRTVAHARIIGIQEKNTTAYINVRLIMKEAVGPADIFEILKYEKRPPRMLLIPMDIRIMPHRNIYPANALDFGMIKAGDKSEQLVMEVYSTVEKSIDIESIYVEKNDYTHSIYMEFASKPPISVYRGSRFSPGPLVALAKVSIDSNYVLRRVNENGTIIPEIIHLSGRIVAESRGGNYNVSVPYSAMIYSGDVMHNAEEVAFHSKLKTPVRRGVSLTNHLPFDIAIHNVSIDEKARAVFKATLVRPTLTLAARERKTVVLLEYIQPQDSKFSSVFTVYTNVTNFEVPIVIFNGELDIVLHSEAQDKFEFGALELHKTRSIRFAVVNKNAAEIVLNKFHQPFETFSWLQLIGIEAGNGTKPNAFHERYRPAWKPGKDFVIPASSTAMFKFTISGNPGLLGLNEEFVIGTDYSEYRFPVTLSLSNYSIHTLPPVINYGKVFPGMMVTKDINIMSTFPEDLPVDRISLSNNDQRFFFEKASDNAAPMIQKGSMSRVARLMLKPDAAPTNEHYVGLPLHTSDGQWFSYGLKLPANLAEIDSYLYRRMKKRYNALVASGRNQINASVVIDTPTVKNFEVPIKADLVWPKLLSHSVVQFPMTALGNFTVVNLTLTNPSSKPVIVQILPLVIYPHAQSFLDFFTNDLPGPLIEFVETNETLMFSLRDTELFTLKPTSPIPQLRDQVESIVGGSIPRFTLTMIMQPKMKTRVRIGFLPADYELHSSLLVIRNNLTIIEPVVLYGKGARIDMKVENKSARSTPTLFDIQTNHLKDCFNPKRQMHKLSTTLTVKRPFEVVNTGEIPFLVTNITINNLPCENRGFHIINCHPFRIGPGETHVLDIAYTPDFLMSVNEASLQLYMHMNGTPWVFYIGATIPPHMLLMCHSALPRPPFENFMYYSCILALVFCIICVLACSYLEGDRLITYTIRQEASIDSDTHLHGITMPIPKQPPVQNRRRPSHFRNQIQVTQDNNFLVRWVANAANLFLWMFSFVWMAVRSEPEVTEASRKRKNKKQKPVAVAPPLPPAKEAKPLFSTINNKLDVRRPILENRRNSTTENAQKEMEMRSRKPTKTSEEDKRSETASTAKKSRKQKSPREAPVATNRSASAVKPNLFEETIEETTETPAETTYCLKTSPTIDIKSATNVVTESVVHKEIAQAEETIVTEDAPEVFQKDEVEVSESEVVPEWADAEIVARDNDVDFANLVSASADVFGSRPPSPGSTSSLSSAAQRRNVTVPQQATASESESDSDESEIPRPNQKRSRRPRTRDRKSKLPADVRNYIDLMTKKFRENLVAAFTERSRQAEESEQQSWPLSMVDQSSAPPSFMNTYYAQQMASWNAMRQQYQNQYHDAYNQYMSPYMDNKNTRLNSYSQNTSAMPSNPEPVRSNPLGPIGSAVEAPRQNVSHSNNAVESDSWLSFYGYPTGAPSPPPATVPSRSSDYSPFNPFPTTSTTPDNRQYSLFNQDPVWQPLHEDMSLPRESAWPDLDPENGS
uniref:TMEM131_like domain-containing protein n=1 Tax=Panagrellus redivivus TaxID=6233 RepID=A0A7E4ULZ0_PANRE